MKERRLVIVGINYAPEQTGIAPYTTGLAEHMAASGWQVTVATGMPHYPQWKVDPNYRRTFRVAERCAGVDIRRLRHFVPDHHSVFGRGLYELTFSLQAVAQRALGDPDCVIGVVPSLGGGAAAARLARRADAPFGVIFQDLVGPAAEQSGAPGGGKAARAVQGIERWVANRADGVVVVAEAFRPYLERAGVRPDRIVHLRNWAHVPSPTGRAPEVRTRLGWTDKKPIILHAGNMGYKQDLANVLLAARLAQSESLPLRFVLMGDGAERDKLEVIAGDLSNVQILDPQPRDLFMDVLAAADVLVLNERASVLDMSLPSKLTSYFRSGRPVVASVPLSGTTACELRLSGAALLTPAGDPDALLRGLREVLANPMTAARLVRRAQDFAESSFNGRVLLEGLESFIDELAVSRREVPYARARSRFSGHSYSR